MGFPVKQIHPNPEYLLVSIFINCTKLLISKNPLYHSIKGEQTWLNLDQFR
jgi:hypothetical protein